MRLSCGRKWKLISKTRCPWWTWIYSATKTSKMCNHKFDEFHLWIAPVTHSNCIDLLIEIFWRFPLPFALFRFNHSTTRQHMENKDLFLNVPNSLFSFASSHRFTTLMTPFPATRGISNVPPMRSMFCNTFRFNSPLSLFGVVFVISWPKFDAGGILTVIFFSFLFIATTKNCQKNDYSAFDFIQQQKKTQAALLHSRFLNYVRIN